MAKFENFVKLNAKSRYQIPLGLRDIHVPLHNDKTEDSLDQHRGFFDVATSKLFLTDHRSTLALSRASVLVVVIYGINLGSFEDDRTSNFETAEEIAYMS